MFQLNVLPNDFGVKYTLRKQWYKAHYKTDSSNLSVFFCVLGLYNISLYFTIE